MDNSSEAAIGQCPEYTDGELKYRIYVKYVSLKLMGNLDGNLVITPDFF